MKKIFILLSLFSLFIASCKKEVNNESESSKLNLLAQKYHLSKIDTLVLKPTKSFKDAEELENYLNGRNTANVPKDYSFDLANSANNNLRPDDDTGQAYGSTQFSALINCPEWGAVGFPNLIIFNWLYDAQYSRVSNMTTQLIVTGGNAGTYTFYPRTANGYVISSGIHFIVTGLYVETYSVAGLYSYSKAFNYYFQGDYSYPTIHCTVNYVAQ